MSGIRILIMEFLPAGFVSILGTGVAYGVSLLAGHPTSLSVILAILSGLLSATLLLNLIQVIDQLERTQMIPSVNQ